MTGIVNEIASFRYASFAMTILFACCSTSRHVEAYPDYVLKKTPLSAASRENKYLKSTI